MEGEELGLLGGEGGDSAEVVEEGGSEIEEEVPSGEGSEQGEGEAGGETPGEDEGERGAGRAVPTDLRKAIREFVTNNPEFGARYPRLERQLTAAMFKAGQADRMGGLPALRSAMQLMEQHGGAEGIASLAEAREKNQFLEQGFRTGDPELLDTWASTHPDGFKGSLRDHINKVEAMDLAAHDRAMAEPLWKTLDRVGFINSMGELKNAIAGERFEDIQKHFGALDQFMADLRQFMNRAKQPQADPLKADREAIAAEREEIQSERTKTFYGGVRTEVSNQVIEYTNRLLRQELAGKKLRVETANRVRKQINEDLAAAVNTAPGYADRYKSIMGANDHQRAVNFIVQNARAKLPGVVRRVLRDFNLTGTAGATLGTPRRVGASGSRMGTSTVTGRPKTGDVDFTRTDKAQYLGSLNGHGEAWLRNGKKARW